MNQDNWDNPVLSNWLATLDHTIALRNEPLILVAHSLGCALAVHWMTANPGRISAALFVAPADVDSPTHTPESVRTFAPMPNKALNVPSCVVASVDDPYVDLSRAEQFAGNWRSELINIGRKGHINDPALLNDWEQGWSIVHRLVGSTQQGV